MLSDFFYRFQTTDALTLRNNAEFVALSRISAQLDRALVEPFQPDYVQSVHAARQRVAGDYEGLAPGVVPSDDA